MDYIVSVKGVSKSYGEVQALKDVCFEVKPGEIFGLIGPDGAGKTTLFRILTTLVLADEGKAEVCGQDVVKNYKEIRRQAGYMPGRFSRDIYGGGFICCECFIREKLFACVKKCGGIRTTLGAIFIPVRRNVFVGRV